MKLPKITIANYWIIPVIIHTAYLQPTKKEDGLSPSVKLYGNFNITPKQTLEVTAKTAYTQNDYTRTYTEGENISLTDVDEELYAFDFSTRYNIKLEHNNSLGANLQHHHKVVFLLYG